MNFLTKSQPLDFSNKQSEGFQYYQWKYKQKLAEEEEEQRRLQKMYQRIVEEEKMQAKTKKPTTQYYTGDFYDYNVAWKKKIQVKVHEQKIIQQKEKQNKQKWQMEENKWKKENKNLLQTQYKGPISGWQNHFNNYLKTKSNFFIQKEEENTFQPQINLKSKHMTRKFTQKVEDRLLRIGQSMKIKKKQMSIMDASVSKPVQTQGNKQIFQRLYNEGEKANRKKAHLSSQNSFQPTLSEMSKQLERRVCQKRKPLYYIKDKNENENENKENEKKKIKSHASFQNFLKRNQALLEVKRKNKLKFKEQVDEEEKRQQKMCTFSPKLNTNSIKIYKNLTNKEDQFSKGFSSNIQEFKPTQRLHSGHKIHESMIQESSVKCNQKSEGYDSLEQSDSISKYHAFSDVKHEDEKATQRKSRLIKSNVLLFQGPVQEQQQEEQQNEMTGFGSQTIIQKYEHDSIDRMKDEEWETQLQEIQDQLQGMMIRARQAG